LKHVEAQIKDGPQTREVIIEAARLFLEFKELKQPPEKTLILARALENEYATESPIGYILEAQTLLGMNRSQDAVTAMQNGLKVDPTDEWLLENMVFARLALHDVPGAASTVEAWIKAKPTATKALLVMAYLKYNSKDLTGAIPHLQKILEIAGGTPNEPHHPEALNLMGQIYSQLNQSQDAILFFRKACESGFSQACDNQLLKTAQSAVPSGAQPVAPTAPDVQAPSSKNPEPASVRNEPSTTAPVSPPSN
jgi:tetratricopeptide (TPR) repeat protein